MDRSRAKGSQWKEGNGITKRTIVFTFSFCPHLRVSKIKWHICVLSSSYIRKTTLALPRGVSLPDGRDREVFEEFLRSLWEVFKKYLRNLWETFEKSLRDGPTNCWFRPFNGFGYNKGNVEPIIWIINYKVYRASQQHHPSSTLQSDSFGGCKRFWTHSQSLYIPTLPHHVQYATYYYFL